MTAFAGERTMPGAIPIESRDAQSSSRRDYGAVAFGIIWAARAVLVWMLAGAILAMALNPAVEWLRRHGVHRRGAAVTIVFLAFLGAVVAAGALIIPPLVSQITDFIHAVPSYVDDITHGRGPLGFLETKYQVVERVQKAVDESGGAKVLAHAGVLVSIGKGIVSFITTSLTIATFRSARTPSSSAPPSIVTRNGPPTAGSKR